MLIVESVFTWDIEGFVDLCFDVVSFVTTLIFCVLKSRFS